MAPSSFEHTLSGRLSSIVNSFDRLAWPWSQRDCTAARYFTLIPIYVTRISLPHQLLQLVQLDSPIFMFSGTAYHFIMVCPEYHFHRRFLHKCVMLDFSFTMLNVLSYSVLLSEVTEIDIFSNRYIWKPFAVITCFLDSGAQDLNMRKCRMQFLIIVMHFRNRLWNTYIFN